MTPALLPTYTTRLPSDGLNATTGEAATPSPVFTCHLTPRVLALLVVMVVSADVPLWPESCPNVAQSSSVAAPLGVGATASTSVLSNAATRTAVERLVVIPLGASPAETALRRT